MRHLLILFFGIMTSITALAYPELIRHGYNNCQACHVAPSGGGTLSSYGRSLSAELMSAWGTEKEAGFLHGAFDREKLESKVLMGGDIRMLQAHKEDEFVKAGRFIKMQSDIGAAIVRGAWTLAANVGAWEQDTWKATVSNAYLMYKPLDELSIRIGQFIPQYGIYIKDHIYFIRSFLGLGLDSQKNTVEVQWTGEDWTSQISLATDKSGTLNNEKIITLQVQRYFLDKHKVAFNYWHSSADTYTKDVLGTWALLGFTKKIFLLLEADLQQKNENAANTKSLIEFLKFGYTFTQGLDGLVLAESVQSDLADSKTKIDRYGLGFQFFPRPHFELSGAWLKQANHNVSDQWGDYAWLQLHYYF